MRIGKDHPVKQLISFVLFVTVEVFCINGVTVLSSSGGGGFLQLWSIRSIFFVTCSCACASSASSSTMQQNIRATLITHFSHLNRASLTQCIPLHVYPAGSTSPLISPLLSSISVFISVSPVSCYPCSASSSLVWFNFYFCIAQGAAPGEHYFSKSIIMHHCKDTCSNQLNHLVNDLCAIKLKRFASVDQMDVLLFSAQHP